MKESFDTSAQAARIKEISSRLMALQMLRRYAVQKAEDKEGLYFGQLPIIEYVMENPGCTQVEMAQYLGISNASASLSTKRLQNAGFISKQVDRDNLRCNKLYITESGKEAALRNRSLFDRVDAQMLFGLDAGDFERLKELLGKMIANLTDGSTQSLDRSEFFSLRGKVEKLREKNGVDAREQ